MHRILIRSGLAGLALAALACSGSAAVAETIAYKRHAQHPNYSIWATRQSMLPA